MLILHVDISIMILSCIYLGRSADTVLISILQFKTKSGKIVGNYLQRNLALGILNMIP